MQHLANLRGHLRTARAAADEAVAGYERAKRSGDPEQIENAGRRLEHYRTLAIIAEDRLAAIEARTARPCAAAGGV